MRLRLPAARGRISRRARTRRVRSQHDTIAASILRDIERHAATEADHVVGDLLQRGGKNPGAYPLLQIAYANLRTYEAWRQREAAGAAR